ncbi:Hypothetical leucine rich repeat protein [Ectocarpus siliculosus]|uniref:Hypothetical leucine rich repeat protein n=1 Tax=Ectocarpus siliculosus TaxID=2880 RepID=D7FIN7_ECTSI|nr:Hypothetical leucine rich repeat protein [Ectocarpus siliculosus]|eukprot:CBJ28855.1 Hypothetical leucine rich repeat protein [Ectocarpus siliculosus]
MADGTIVRQKKDKDGGGDAAQSLIRKLTTEKAVKAHRQETQQTSITEDDITNVKLTSRGIKTIESLELPSLRRLDLSKNSLNRLKGLQGCPQVTYLTAASNELTGDGLDGVRPLKDLKVFNASGNRVRRIPPAVFAQFRQLQALVLSDNEISEVPPTWLKQGLLSLNTLVLSHNKLKSLSGTGLGRLTALTKLSISYNTLVELPDLSACSGLEELRAAHNIVTQVPASLSKNAALRTLDLGHNRIDDWVGLERLGKSLKSLMQLSLSGNPICGAAAAAEKSGTGEEDGEEGYVAKVRSLFPGLKRGGEQGAGAGAGGGRKDSALRGTTPGTGGKRAPGSGTKARPVKSDGVDGGGGDKSGDREGGQLVSRKPKEESSRPKEMRVGQQGQGSGASSANMDEEGAGTSKEERKRKRKAARKAAAEEAQTEAAAAIPNKQDRNTKKRRRREEEEGRERSGSSPVEEAAAAAPSESADKLTKKQRRRRREEGTTAVETIAAAGAATTVVSKKKKKTATSGGEGGRAQQQEDPYSSSEELPIPGRGDGGDSLAREEPAAKRAADAAVPVRESGVVSVVINTKRKGAKAKARQDSSAAGRPGGGGGLGGFSVGAMLEARGQKETIGLGSRVSAWD